MPRSVKEWIGKNDDAKLPSSVKLRIVERQRDRCGICTRKFDSRLRPEFDHEVPLALGGEHRERNIRALCGECHRPKTKEDANAIGRARRIKQKTLGIKKPKQKSLGRWKRKVNGTVVLRDEEGERQRRMTDLEEKLTDEVIRLKKIIKQLKRSEVQLRNTVCSRKDN